MLSSKSTGQVTVFPHYVDGNGEDLAVDVHPQMEVVNPSTLWKCMLPCLFRCLWLRAQPD